MEGIAPHRPYVLGSVENEQVSWCHLYVQSRSLGVFIKKSLRISLPDADDTAENAVMPKTRGNLRIDLFVGMEAL